MRLSDKTKWAIQDMLYDCDFSHREVTAVLEHGNEKHGDDDACVHEHIAHALSHLAMSGSDEEAKQSHWAHAVARLFLAILAVMEEEKNAARKR